MSISVASRGGRSARSARSRSAFSRSARSASGGSARGYARLASGKTSAEVAFRILEREDAFGGGVFEGAARIDARNANRGGASDRSGFTGNGGRRASGRRARSAILSKSARSGSKYDGNRKKDTSLHLQKSPKFRVVKLRLGKPNSSYSFLIGQQPIKI